MRNALWGKAGALALVGWMVAMALWRIEGLVDERRVRGDEALRGVEQSHAAAQALVGPLLQRTCTEEWDSVVDTDKGRVASVEKRDFLLVETPATLSIDGRTTADPLHRGLFKINAFVAHASVTAEFANLAALRPRADHAGGRLQCAPPVLLVALTDVRGLRSARVTMDGQALDVAPGTTSDQYPHGLHALLPAARVDGAAGDAATKVALSVDLVGTRQLAWVPAAGDVTWTLASDWPHPSFGGQFAPQSRAVGDAGFSATWRLSALASSAAADVATGRSLCEPDVADVDAPGERVAVRPAACLDTMGVAFIDPVNPYVLSDRATKYALLFVALTFVGVAMIEVLSGRRVHPVQYLLVGLALSLFFLLLLSLSEHLPFAAAYVVAAAACSGLLGLYATAMLGRAVAGTIFGAGVAALYTMLYVLLQMEQNALVIGAVMLFAGLAAVMMLTRRVDWYALFDRLGSRSAAPGA